MGAFEIEGNMRWNDMMSDVEALRISPRRDGLVQVFPVHDNNSLMPFRVERRQRTSQEEAELVDLLGHMGVVETPELAKDAQ